MGTDWVKLGAVYGIEVYRVGGQIVIRSPNMDDGVKCRVMDELMEAYGGGDVEYLGDKRYYQGVITNKSIDA